MEHSEKLLTEELDRVIWSLNMRIEQQRIHILELSASSNQVAVANVVLDKMLKGLGRLKSRRSQFA
jgi:hypothetical protein